MGKTLKIALIAFGLAAVLAVISNFYDGDLGWHLRFGQEAWAGHFPYLNTWSWPAYGQPWVNHEWGGDLIYWFLYQRWGFLSLAALASAGVLAAFLLVQKIFFKKLTAFDFLMAVIFIGAIKFTLAARLTVVAPLFFAWLWLTLEKLPERKNYFYFWPLILWLWSTLHGSWILGFIVINIYIIGNALSLLFPSLAGKLSNWNWRMIKQALFWQIISAGIVCLNPYGLKIWSEVGAYFTEGYYKNYITEWLPSYAYPVYVWPLVIAGAAVVFIFIGWKKKTISLTQIFLFLAFFVSAMQYKRNNIYLALICLPLLTSVLKTAGEKIKKAQPRFGAACPRFGRPLLLAAVLAGLIFFSGKIKLVNDVFQNEALVAANGFPYHAIEFMKQKIGEKKTYLFNDFNWGGHIVWTLPNALVYLDGRGTATWRWSEQETALEHYRKIKYETGGLAEIENGPTEYIFLKKPRPPFAAPDRINRLIFSEDDFKKIFTVESVQLIEDLKKSASWRLIYEDELSLIWKRQ